MRIKHPAWLGGAVLVLAAAFGQRHLALFYACWLAAWCFFAGLMLGAQAIGCIHRLTGGRWGATLLAPIRLLRRPMAWAIPLFLPLLFGGGSLYPWWRGDAGFFWFGHTFVAMRFIAYAFGIAWLSRATEAPSAGSAAARLLLWMLLGSLAAVDLLMSLTPGWTSSVFGWLVLCSQMTSGTAAAIALAALGPSHRQQPPPWRDLGNLLLMFVMLQAYLQFMQLLIIWAENLPREISWYLPRLEGGWRFVGLALVLLQFALPQLALLFRSVKDDRRKLGRLALVLVAVQALHGAWLVLPSVDAGSYAGWSLLPLIWAGMGLLLFGLAFPRRRSYLKAAHGRS